VLFSIDKEDVEMIRCSNADCWFGAWFHVTCLHVSEIPAGDWWCSDECRDTGRSIFCHCKTVQPGPIVICANADCQNGSQFHVNCVIITCQPGMMCIKIPSSHQLLGKHDICTRSPQDIAVLKNVCAGTVSKLVYNHFS